MTYLGWVARKSDTVPHSGAPFRDTPGEHTMHIRFFAEQPHPPVLGKRDIGDRNRWTHPPNTPTHTHISPPHLPQTLFQPRINAGSAYPILVQKKGTHSGRSYSFSSQNTPRGYSGLTLFCQKQNTKNHRVIYSSIIVSRPTVPATVRPSTAIVGY